MRYLLLACLAGLSVAAFAQDDLLSMVEEKKEGAEKVYATFKTLRIGNAQTIETEKKNHLDFRIGHRFDKVYDGSEKNSLNAAAQRAFGFDAVSDIRFSFDYGITDELTVGIGRSKLNHLFDGNVKWRFLTQKTDFSIPVSIAFFSSLGYSSAPFNDIYGNVVMNFDKSELHRFNFFHQLIIASKLSSWLSLELLPSYFHRNYIQARVNSANGGEDQNGIFSLGFGGRLKMTKRISFIGDYFYNFSQFYKENSSQNNPLALGVEIETGGHVFSLFFTNASGLIENNFIIDNVNSWSKGQVKFGFSISRTFSL